MTDSTGVTITLPQIYNELQSTHSEVRDMRIEVRAAIADISDHETRLRALERKVWLAMGAAGVLGGGLSAGITVGARLLTGT